MPFVHGNYEFGNRKQNLSVDQRVVLGRTSSEDMDGATGTILGKSYDDSFIDSYIVLLDVPLNGQKAISLIEGCICPL